MAQVSERDREHAAAVLPLTRYPSAKIYIDAVEAEFAAYREEIEARCQALTCMYCGREAPLGTPEEELWKHTTCPEHPLPKALERAKKAELDAANAEEQWRRWFHAQADGLKTDYLATIKRLRKQLEKTERERDEAQAQLCPKQTCANCGSFGPFSLLKYDTPGEPIEYDLKCQDCESTDVQDSIAEALDGAIEARAEAEARVQELEQRERLLRAQADRWVPCPDHRDKTVRECPACYGERTEKARQQERLREPACDFAKRLAQQLYHDVNDVPAIETVEEWTEAVAQAIRLATQERMRELPDRVWDAAMRIFELDSWEECRALRWARRRLRRECR